MAGVVIELASAELGAALAALEGRLIDLRPALAEIGEVVVSQTQDSFERQQSPAGEPWEPSQRAMAQGGRTLVDTGQLLAALSLEVMPDEVAVGVAKVYAAVHQLGGKAGRGLSVTLPPRAFLPDADTVDMPEILDAVERHLAEALP